MLRRIIRIDRDKCNGCGLCADACHEGAIGMESGKAVLLRDDYCDGLGNCLPVCPTGAITFEEREALEYSESEVKKNMERNKKAACSCPGAAARALGGHEDHPAPSHLRNWPVQIKLVPVNAPYFSGAHLLVAADCAAYACGDFHSRFMKDKIAVIGCPKLDEWDYSEKLAQILKANDIKSVTVVRMEVPCCGGIEHAARAATEACGKDVSLEVIIMSIDGQVI